MEFNSAETTLSVKSGTETTSTYKVLYGLYKIPEMGGNAEMLDVTNLSDKHKRSIPGIKDVSSLDFEFYNNSGDSDTSTVIMTSYATLAALETDDTVAHWKLMYPDGTGFSWDGRVSVKRAGVGVNEPLKFTARVALETELTAETVTT